MSRKNRTREKVLVSASRCLKIPSVAGREPRETHTAGMGSGEAWAAVGAAEANFLL